MDHSPDNRLFTFYEPGGKVARSGSGMKAISRLAAAATLAAIACSAPAGAADELRRLRIFGQRDKLKANRSKGA